jgi:uncharacterized membrane protein ArfB
MDFVIQWLWYLLAYVAGSAIAWVIATRWIKRGGDQPAPEGAVPQVGAQ